MFNRQMFNRQMFNRQMFNRQMFNRQMFNRQILKIVFLLSFVMLENQARATPINFEIDCMIHDAKGSMLSELGSIGSTMNSGYVSLGNFQYGDLKIEANLNGPFAEAPEVASPQVKFTVYDQNGAILSSSINTASTNLNAALFIPSEAFYLHCDKMHM